MIFFCRHHQWLVFEVHTNKREFKKKEITFTQIRAYKLSKKKHTSDSDWYHPMYVKDVSEMWKSWMNDANWRNWCDSIDMFAGFGNIRLWWRSFIKLVTSVSKRAHKLCRWCLCVSMSAWKCVSTLIPVCPGRFRYKLIQNVGNWLKF